MRLFIVILVITALSSGAVLAGPNEDVVLSIQGNVLGTEIGTQSPPCSGITIPADCEDMDTHAIPTSSGISWYLAVVVSPAENIPNFNTVVFGIGAYDPYGDGYVAFSGPCVAGALEVTTAGWPDPGEGTVVSWAPDCLYGYMEPVYFFGVYSYGGVIPLGLHPEQGGWVADCSDDPQIDPFQGFGEMEGDNPDCPGTEPEPTPTRETTWGSIKSIYR